MNPVLPAAALPASRLRDLVLRAAALIFDVDGTLAETEEVHRQAFNEAFAQAGIDWFWGQAIYKNLLGVTGGKERIRAFDLMRRTSLTLTDLQIAELHRIKTARYTALIAEGGCPLRPGVRQLLDAAQERGQRLAIATTTSAGNIEALLAVAIGPDWASRFDAVVAGDEVARKKPAPDVYLEALSRLELAGSDCIAIEDSRNGLVAAVRAGIPVIITRSIYFQEQEFAEALLAIENLTDLGMP